MWKTSARISNYRSFSCTGNIFCRKSRLCTGKFRGQICEVRPFSNGSAQGRAGSGRGGNLVLGTALLATSAVIGGIYYAKVDPTFRQTVEDKIPYSSTFFNFIFGKSKPQQTKTPFSEVLRPTKASPDSKLFPVTDSTSHAKPSEEKLEQEEPSIQIEHAKPPVTVNVPATVSSVDQVGVSSVDLDISKAVEKGISDAKKEAVLTPQEVVETPKSGQKVAKEEECSECATEKDQEAVKDEMPVAEQKEGISKVDNDTSASDLPSETTDMHPMDVALNMAMATISDIGQKAIELYEQAITAVQNHRDSVKEALERFEKDGVSKGDWELLNKLSEKKSQALNEAEQVSVKLADLVENMQRSITEAKEKGLDTSAEVASETLAKLTYALEQVKDRLADSQSEGSVLKEFKEFIKDGKEHLTKELAAIRPEFEIDTLKDKADGELLAYAQKRIRLLEDTLQAREQHEEKLLQEALTKQQREHEKLSAMKLAHELENLRTELNNFITQKEAQEAERHENDLRTQLRRQAAAFSDHLNNVLKVQATELNTKHDAELREKLLLARQDAELKLRGSLAKINGIISAIRSKADIEKHNVEAQKLWLACHSLSTAITGLGDDRTRPYPIQSEVESIRRVTDGNEIVGKVLDSLSDDMLHRGVLTEESLRRRFSNVERVCRQVAMVPEDGGGVWSYFVSYLQSLFVVETPTVTPPVSIDPEDIDTYKILSLATYALEHGDTEQAVRYVNQLRGEPRRIAKDWIREARLFLEAKQASRFLTSYASAYNIGVEQHK